MNTLNNQMLTSIRLSLFLLSLLLISCTSAKETAIHDTEAVHEEVAETIVQMPVSSPDDQNWLNQQLVETGPAGIQVLAGMLTQPGTGDDTYARYALSSLSTYVSRPGAESERREFEEAILNELRGNYSAESKTFLIQQLALAGSNQSVPLLSGFLTHEKLFSPALRQLAALNTPESIREIRGVLADTDGSRRSAVIKTLGDLQDVASANEILPHASAEEWPLKRISLYALANIGNPIAEEVFSGILDDLDSYETNRQTDILSFYLTYAERVAEEGHPFLSAELNRRILNGDYPENMKSSALSSLFLVEGDQMLDELMERAVSSGPVLSAVALSRANSLEGPRATDALIENLENASSERQADILTTLGHRGDPPALTAIPPYLEASSAGVRVAAAEALFLLGGSEYLQDIVHVLAGATQEEEIEPVESVLLQMPTEDVIRASAEALPEAAQAAKPAFIRILASRRASGHLQLIAQQAESDSEDVRLEVYRALRELGSSEDADMLASWLSEDRSEDENAVIQEALTGVLNRAENDSDRSEMIGRMLEDGSASQKALILGILPDIESVGTGYAVSGLSSSDEEVRNAAVLALAEWRNPSALPQLLDAAAVASRPARSAIYQGYVRLVNLSPYPLEEKARLLTDLAGVTDSPEQKAEIISSFAGADDLVILQAAGAFFDSDDEVVRERALQVAAEVLAPSYASHAAYRSELTAGASPAYGSDNEVFNVSNAVLAVLDQSARSNLLATLEEQAEKAADGAGGDTAGSVDESAEDSRPVFGQIFNGRDLEGWEAVGQNEDSWDVENGVLYTDGEGSGWLSTTSTYDNFRLELEFRVPEGGNSGVFLRTPREGSPASAGMEIQILDDYADQYADLEPWQYTGSIYFAEAASKRVTKPAGEWQSMVIVADGPDIRVTLNDEMIVNTSLVHHMELAGVHTGLTRRSGYIGLQNHSTRVDFRNIFIYEID